MKHSAECSWGFTWNAGLIFGRVSHETPGLLKILSWNRKSVSKPDFYWKLVSHETPLSCLMWNNSQNNQKTGLWALKRPKISVSRVTDRLFVIYWQQYLLWSRDDNCSEELFRFFRFRSLHLYRPRPGQTRPPRATHSRGVGARPARWLNEHRALNL